MFTTGFAIVAIFHLVSQATGECSGSCQTPILLYDDLGCKPVFDKPGDCCASRYDCSNLDNRPRDKCHLRGQFYAAHTDIDKELTYGNCHIGCRCLPTTDYQCAILDCPEWLSGGRYPKPGCYLKYELNKCCGTGEVCPPFDKLAKCLVDGKEYKEGQKFSPPVTLAQKCMECICQPGFQTGQYVEPFCRKSNCTVEIKRSHEVRTYCAPAYMRITDCCPWDWVCPEETDQILKAVNVKRPDLQCKFGVKLLNIADKFERVKIMSIYEKFETKCECLVPPYVTCIKRQIFDLEKAPPHMRPHLSNIV